MLLVVMSFTKYGELFAIVISWPNNTVLNPVGVNVYNHVFPVKPMILSNTPFDEIF
jgi:hypothetical protein